MKHIGILGAKGMLGSDIILLAKEKKIDVVPFDIPEFDITNEAHIKERLADFDTIINCAAYTNVDGAETEKDKAWQVNAIAVGKLANFAKKQQIKILHVSTDFIFGDNSAEPLDEESPTCPLSEYGKSKLEGEKLLCESGCNFAIIRIEWTYGSKGNNFVRKIIELAKSKPRIKVVADQIGSPTRTEQVARAIFCLLERDQEGIFHFAAKGWASRFEVAKFIIEKCDFKTEILPCCSEDFPTPAKRPKNSRFNCSKIDKILNFERETWQEGLKSFLLKHKNDLLC